MNALTGTGRLIRLALRRDRLLLPLWSVLPAVFPMAFVTAFTSGYPTAQARQDYLMTSIHNKAFTVVYGPLNGSSLGELVVWRTGFIPVVIGLLCLLTVIRHTRTEEEAGRRELIGSTAVGRHADLAAALIMTCVATLVLGALSALVLIGAGLPAAGSVAYGLGLVAAGCTFATTGAVVAQLTIGAGKARGIGISVLGFALLLRAIGDVSAQSGGRLGWVSWLSPVGWPHQFQPFAGERWWVLVVAVCAVVVLAAAAVALSARRDVGSGLLRPRPGPAAVGAGPRSPQALAWRLHRGSLAGRTAGFAVVGFALGAIAENLGGQMAAASPAARDVLARLGGQGAIIDQYFVAITTLSGVAAAAYAIAATLRMRAEESSGRAEPLLAAPVDRLHWAGSHLSFTLIGPTVGLIVFGVAAGLGHGLNAGDVGGLLPRVLGAALVQLPAVWVFAGLTFALFGLLPRLAAGAFAVLLVSLLLGWVGAELGLSRWVTDLSIFSHLPRLPGGEVAPLPLVVLTAGGAALIVAGLFGLRRRDMPLG